MENQLFRIGEIAQALGVSIQAIRHYQKKGLLQPTFVDPQTNYRYFDYSTIGRIWQINVLQSAGFTLEEIKQLDLLAEDELVKLIDKKQERLAYEIKQKQLSLSYLQRQKNAMRLRNNTALNYRYIWIEKRHGYKLDVPDDIVGNERLKMISSLKGTYDLNHVVSYQPSRHLRINEHEHELDYLFAIDELGEANDQTIDQEEGLYLCCLIRERSSKSDILNEMVQKALSDGYTLRGDAVEILLMDENLTNHAGAYLREVQIALKTKD